MTFMRQPITPARAGFDPWDPAAGASQDGWLVDLTPTGSLEQRAGRVADAVAHFGLVGVARAEDGTFLDPR